MKIWLINYEFPPLGGGAGNATSWLSAELAALGHDVVVITSRFGRQPAHEIRDGYALVRIPVMRAREDRCSPVEMVSFMVSAAVAVLLSAWGAKPDACIAFFGIPCGPVAWLLKVTFGVPYIVSLRGGDVPGFQPYDLATMHAFVRPIIHKLWTQASAVVANSAGLSALAVASLPTQPVRVIPNGVDLHAYHPHESHASHNSQARILFVGRLVHQKGVDVLLSALAMLRVRSDWELEIIGDGPLRALAEHTAEASGIRERITFLGWLKPEALRARYREADVFAFPSRDEGMPNAVLEAMASGLPIVATRIAGSEELVRDCINGFLVSPDEPAAFARAIAWMLDQREAAAAMGRRSREIAEAEYSWAQAARGYEALLTQAIEGKDAA